MPNDMPPTRTLTPQPPVPDSAAPTTAQLKADIDSGRTGDKVETFDPGLSPLGTDDEAAGTPNSPERVALARKEESKTRWSDGSEKTSPAHNRTSWGTPGFIALIVIVAVLIAVGVWSLR